MAYYFYFLKGMIIMYNQYNPYLNRFYGQQQANMPQPMEMPIQQQNTPQMALNRQNTTTVLFL